MIAYRLGDMPDGERHAEQELLPAGPRISISEAMQLILPDGTLFREAPDGQVIGWFEQLFDRAAMSQELLSDVLTGLDLSDFDARWWALNEMLEVGRVRDAFMGKPRSMSSYQRSGNGLSRIILEHLALSYGLRVSVSHKPDGT